MTVEAKWFDALNEVKAEKTSYFPVLHRWVKTTVVITVALLLAVMVAAPIEWLSGMNENVFAAITLLLSLTWLMSLNFVQRPAETGFVLTMAGVGMTVAFTSMSSLDGLFMVWAGNVVAGLIVLARGWLAELSTQALVGWVVFHLGFIAIVAAF